MTAAASASWAVDTDTAPNPALAAAVKYGVVLISLLRGFTRHALRLGRVTQDVVAALQRKGVDHRSPACGYDIKNIISVLRGALLMADALRVRLLTPAVALATARPPRTASGGARAKRRPGKKDCDDPVALMLWRRTHPHTREAYANMIADMSDRQVMERIYTDLFSAAEVLRATDVGSGIVMLAYKAVLTIFPDLKELAKRKAAPVMAARPKRAGATEGPGVQPVPREMGRGPP